MDEAEGPVATLMPPWPVTTLGLPLSGICTFIQGMYGVNLKKINYKLKDLEHTQEKRSWPTGGHKSI